MRTWDVKTDYQKLLDKEIDAIGISGIRPRLLLHSCCGPCSSYVLEYLSCFFDISVFYYNPNIYPPEEYEKRLSEQKRLIKEMRFPGAVDIIHAEYKPEDFYTAVEGLENEPEGGARCAKCFEIRLDETARMARELSFDYFTTTLSVSPHKNTEILNEIGQKAGKKYGVRYLFADFKKKNGYKRSIELAREYGIYRQNYCGCEFSLRAGIVWKNEHSL
ncbi:MAG: epoxyqueuosine reductase QueH [Oscillospiraceae bacterium]